MVLLESEPASSTSLLNQYSRHGSLAGSNGLVCFLFIIFVQSRKAALKFTCNSHVLLVSELAQLQIMIAELSGNDSTTQTMYLVFKRKFDSLNSNAMRGWHRCRWRAPDVWHLSMALIKTHQKYYDFHLQCAKQRKREKLFTTEPAFANLRSIPWCALTYVTDFGFERLVVADATHSTRIPQWKMGRPQLDINILVYFGPARLAARICQWPAWLQINY
jgi:hypothetical protein